MHGVMKTAVSVPGKLILMGEHAVVYGRPALVATLGMRLHVHLSPEADGVVQFVLPQIRVEERLDWTAVERYAEAARQRWEAYRANPRGDFAEVIGKDPTHLLKVALGEAAAWCSDQVPPGVRIDVESEIPIGSGFGSSAAAAVAIVAGWLHYVGREVDFETLDHLTLEVERRQHGLPSGVDPAAVLRGGLVWARRRDDGSLKLHRLNSQRKLLSKIRIYHTGPPAESTGEVVTAVRRLRDDDPEEFSRLLDRMEFATRQLRARLQDDDETVTGVIRSVQTFQRGLEQLGVVPEPIRDVVRQVEERGGAAKVSGAGSLEGPGAGCLLVVHDRPEEIDGWAFLDPFLEHRVAVGVDGLREEVA